MPPSPPFVPTFLDDLPVAKRALAYARERHAGQERSSDHATYILHPLEVASLLLAAGYDEDVIAAALLHDTIEDTGASEGDLAELFGEKICRLVSVLTESRSIESYDDRKSDLRDKIAEYGADATAIFAADKIAKARELRAEISRNAGRLSETHRARLAHYQHSLTMLEETPPPHRLTRQLRFELEALHWLPPASAAGDS